MEERVIVDRFKTIFMVGIFTFFGLNTASSTNFDKFLVVIFKKTLKTVDFPVIIKSLLSF